MSDIKMSEMFPEAFQVEHNKSFEVQDATWYSYGEKYESDCDQDSAIAHAVLNHDRLVEENKQQRESLDAFRELVRSQTQTMNELNEKCKKQSKLIKEITYESGGKWYSGLHGDSDITDIVGDLLD